MPKDQMYAAEHLKASPDRESDCDLDNCPHSENALHLMMVRISNACHDIFPTSAFSVARLSVGLGSCALKAEACCCIACWRGASSGTWYAHLDYAITIHVYCPCRLVSATACATETLFTHIDWLPRLPIAY